MKKQNEIKNILQMKSYEARLKAESQSPINYSKVVPSCETKFSIVSLFSGAGGLDLGFDLAGIEATLGQKAATRAFLSKNYYQLFRDQSLFRTIYANDIFPEALETFKSNMHPSTYCHLKNIQRIKEFPKADIVLGGFPCPGFSEAGPRLVDDERNFLYLHFIRCLMDTQPKFFVAENVKGMLTLGGGEVFKQIKEDFEAAGYNVKTKLLNARDFGVPQTRERVIIVGVRTDLDFHYSFPEPTHGPKAGLKPYVTLKDAIGDIETDPGFFYQGGYSSMYMSRNRKRSWHEQSFTIQASGRQAPLHPSGEPMRKINKDLWEFPDSINEHRRLSIKEVARIQTFPDWFEFSMGENKKTSKNGRIDKVYKQIGNAVPISLAKVISLPIANYLKISG
ncbi:DNA cytosine methyltransferase [Marinococcus luteus]|uniref:DNA cytosine methyltransferase n=1 Tax=Marinococcus luteus TaxID=1122204 RepID=UPI002ACD0C28|nr:DNA cytosine methyltransferase [Marinococcus luteus]MDZ5781894.1 DNA cytosine methyltransferase [Marinococcus luteus]